MRPIFAALRTGGRCVILSKFGFPARSVANMASTLPNLTAEPAANQIICHEGKEYTTIKEGLAYILVPASASKTPQTTPKGDNQPQSVFYNPIQQFNRDLSVLAIKAYGEQVVKHKRIVLDRHSKRTKEKKDKKRKRAEDDIPANISRKAGRLEDGNATAAGMKDRAENTTGADGVAASEEQLLTPKVPEVAESSIEAADLDKAVVDEMSTTGTTPAPPKEEEAKPRPVYFSILDALSATGLRALRYSKEIPFTTSVTANDLLEEATKTIRMNVSHNKLDEKIKTITGNALIHMYSLVGDDCKDEKGAPRPSLKYDVIDLDPYGTAAPFLDAAVQAVRDDGGLLCVTCTDAGVWASNGYPEKAFSLYGGTTIKGNHSHEGGLRLILHAIASSAARYGMAMEPLLSLSIDFYARVFVRIYKSPADVKFLAGKTMMVYNCDQGCGAYTTQMIGRNKVFETKKAGTYAWKHTFGLGPSATEKCAQCGTKTHIGGPMYGGPLHSAEFIERILESLPNVSKDTYQTTDRIEGMLTLALEELIPPKDEPNSPTATSVTKKYDPAAIDPAPLLFIPSSLSKVIHCITPLETSFRGALRHLGYSVTRSHTKAGSIKTDAPWDVIWEVMREWARQKKPIKEGSIRKGTPGYAIMGLDKAEIENKVAESEVAEGDGEKEVAKKIEVVFDDALGANAGEKRKKLVRYQLNPRENWGPMNRAKGPP